MRNRDRHLALLLTHQTARRWSEPVPIFLRLRNGRGNRPNAKNDHPPFETDRPVPQKSNPAIFRIPLALVKLAQLVKSGSPSLHPPHPLTWVMPMSRQHFGTDSAYLFGNVKRSNAEYCSGRNRAFARSGITASLGSKTHKTLWQVSCVVSLPFVMQSQPFTRMSHLRPVSRIASLKTNPS